MSSKKKLFLNALSKQKKPIMEEFVSKMNPKQSTRENITEYMERRKKRKWLLATILTLFFVIFTIFLFYVNNDTESRILLSETLIDTNVLEEFKGQNNFQKNKPIFLYFLMQPETFNYLTIQVFDMKNKLVAESKSKIKKKLKFLSNYFQAGFFDLTGEYTIVVLNENNKIIATTEFHIL